MENKLSLRQRIKVILILLFNGSLFSEAEMEEAAKRHSKPLGCDGWTHDNSFKEGARWLYNKIIADKSFAQFEEKKIRRSCNILIALKRFIKIKFIKNEKKIKNEIIENMEEPIFGEPTCMICGEICSVVEYINTPIEMWCYCKKCNTDTFHKPLNAGSEYDE